MSQMMKCESCDGRGCHVCDGTGEVFEGIHDEVPDAPEVPDEGAGDGEACDEETYDEGDDERGYNPYTGGYDDDC